MIASTRTARLTPLSIVRAGCRRILVDDSHNTLVWGPCENSRSGAGRVGGAAPGPSTMFLNYDKDYRSGP
jgi:hypothetical protein